MAFSLGNLFKSAKSPKKSRNPGVPKWHIKNVGKNQMLIVNGFMVLLKVKRQK